jgi:hypothetical protein
MPSSGMLLSVALVITGVSEELSASTRRNIPEDAILNTEVFHLLFRVRTLHFAGNNGRVR